MKDLIEPILLFLVLFFPRFNVSAAAAGPEAFDLISSCAPSLFYRIPAAALVLRLWAGKTTGPLKPRTGDLAVFCITLPALAAIGFAAAGAARVSGLFPGSAVPPPEGITGWIAVVLLSLSAGYLEESYFRVYLVDRLCSAGLGFAAAAGSSTLLFSFCHFYEGPWGLLNAAAAGFFLSWLYFKKRSVHGIALGHGFYNIFVYAVSALASN